MKAMLTVAEAARHYGVAVRTVRGAVARGVLPATRVTDRLYLIAREDLGKWIPQRRRGRPSSKGE